MSPKESSEMDALVKTAVAKLEQLWIKREQSQRSPAGGTKQSEATKQCRLDLAREFGLNKIP